MMKFFKNVSLLDFKSRVSQITIYIVEFLNILLLIKMLKSMNPKVQCAMNITKEQQKKNAFKPTSERESII